MVLKTPYYFIDEHKLLGRLEKIHWLRHHAGVKVVLALKCFATWPVFRLMREYMDGTTSSSLYEARLGHEEFGGETHAYSVAFSANDISHIPRYADKIIFNSLSQLQSFYPAVSHLEVGLRLNPQISFSSYDLADPARRYSRLGVSQLLSPEITAMLSGIMFHYNCDNHDFQQFSAMLDYIGEKYGMTLGELSWVSLGGGVDFTADDYPLEAFADRLRAFSEAFDIQVYLEPGEAAISGAASLVTSVLDIVHNEKDIAIVDSSIEAHMPDLLIYRAEAELAKPMPVDASYRYLVAGKTCLAGDVFGEFSFDAPLQTGDRIEFADAAGYTMVKMNWFNGLRMPSIVIKRLDGEYEQARQFNYYDFKSNLGYSCELLRPLKTRKSGGAHCENEPS